MTQEIMLINRGFSDINPLAAGYENCAPEHSYGPCARDYYMIHYVVSGKGKFKTGEKTYSLTAGDMFLFSPRAVFPVRRYRVAKSPPEGLYPMNLWVP